MGNAIVLDEIPRPILLGFMILGFITFWPIGLAVLGYLMWSGKMRLGHNGSCSSNGNWKSWKARSGLSGSSGNRAFDDYRDDTMRRLEEEARDFRTFMDKLRQAKDKAEFDHFMSERGPRPSSASGGTSTL